MPLDCVQPVFRSAQFAVALLPGTPRFCVGAALVAARVLPRLYAVRAPRQALHGAFHSSPLLGPGHAVGQLQPRLRPQPGQRLGIGQNLFRLTVTHPAAVRPRLRLLRGAPHLRVVALRALHDGPVSSAVVGADDHIGPRLRALGVPLLCVGTDHPIQSGVHNLIAQHSGTAHQRADFKALHARLVHSGQSLRIPTRDRPPDLSRGFPHQVQNAASVPALVGGGYALLHPLLRALGSDVDSIFRQHRGNLPPNGAGGFLRRFFQQRFQALSDSERHHVDGRVAALNQRADQGLVVGGRPGGLLVHPGLQQGLEGHTLHRPIAIERPSCGIAYLSPRHRADSRQNRARSCADQRALHARRRLVEKLGEIPGHRLRN